MGGPGLGELRGHTSASGVQLGRTRWRGGAIRMVESVQATCSGMAERVKGQRWERGLKLKLQSGVNASSGLVFPLLSSTLVF